MLRKQFISHLAKLIPASALAPQSLWAQQAQQVKESSVIVLGSTQTASQFGGDALRISPAALVQIRSTEEGFVCTDFFGKSFRAARLVLEANVHFDTMANTMQLENPGLRTTLQLFCGQSPESPVLVCAQKQRFDADSARRFAKRKGNSLLLLS